MKTENNVHDDGNIDHSATLSQSNLDEDQQRKANLASEGEVLNKPGVENKKDESNVAIPLEEQVRQVVSQMEAALTKNGHPDLKAFWKARKECLTLFQKNIIPGVKALYWEKYRELTNEAKKLKGIFEEKSAFAAEQIEKAIEATEAEIANLENVVAKSKSIEFANHLIALQAQLPFYQEKQKTLTVLQAHATRINALRKELIRTEMRIRKKNAFFQRLSTLGDLVFPKRKKMIQEISKQFVDDVKEFVSLHFKKMTKQANFRSMREEIKGLQAAAKFLTLNTEAFTQARLVLSECWDEIKSLEKEKKRETALEREAQKEITNNIREKIECYQKEVATQKLSVAQAQQQYRELQQLLRSKNGLKEETKLLQNLLNQAYKPIKNKLVEEEKARRKAEFEKEAARQTQIKEIEEKIVALHDKIERQSVSQSHEDMQFLLKEIELLNLNELEKNSLFRLLSPINDALRDKKKDQLLALSNEDPEKILLLENLLQNSREQKAEIEKQKEKIRSACSGSGLDFEQSMYFNEQLAVEKKRLETANSVIATLESAIKKLR